MDLWIRLKYNVPFHFLAEIDKIAFVIVFKVNLPRTDTKNEGLTKKIPNLKASASELSPDFWVKICCRLFLRETAFCEPLSKPEQGCLQRGHETLKMLPLRETGHFHWMHRIFIDILNYLHLKLIHINSPINSEKILWRHFHIIVANDPVFGGHNRPKKCKVYFLI